MPADWDRPPRSSAHARRLQTLLGRIREFAQCTQCVRDMGGMPSGKMSVGMRGLDLLSQGSHQALAGVEPRACTARCAFSRIRRIRANLER